MRKARIAVAWLVGTTMAAMLAIAEGCVGSDPAPAAGEPSPDASGTVTPDGGGSGSDAADAAVFVPECSAECLPQVDGWEGPFPLALGGDGGAPPACPGDGGSSTFRDLDAGPATCNGCTTPAPSAKPSCKYEVQSFTSGDCSGTPTITNVNGDDQCHPIPAATSVKFADKTVGTGACPPVIGTFAQKPTPQWGSEARACPRPFAACGTSCVQRPLADGYKDTCIRHDGDVACPPAVYRFKILTYRRYEDTRACNCTATYKDDGCVSSYDTGDNAPTSIFARGTSCPLTGYEYWIASQNTCVPGTKLEPDGTFESMKASAMTLAGPRCVVDGGLAGGVAPADPVTLCCVP